jgi:hypothetical protein
MKLRQLTESLPPKHVRKASSSTRESTSMLYSDDSYRRLVTNDTMRYETGKDVMRGYKVNSGHSVYLLNTKYKYRQFVPF